MSKFIFRLKSILELKVQLENNLKNNLSIAILALENEKLKLNNIISLKNAISEELINTEKQGVSISKIKEISSYIKLLNQKELKQIENIKLAQENVDRYREELIKVIKERKVLEKLKEKRYNEYVKEEMKKDQLLIDEVVNFRYSKKDE